MNFIRIAKIVFIIGFINFSVTNISARETLSSGFDWNPVMDAIVKVESGGDLKAKNGIYVGAMQIAPIAVKECNVILQQRGSKKRYTLNDRFSLTKSKEMFILIMSKYNPDNNVERAIRIWNGGVRYNHKKTQGYYRKVMSHINKGEI